MRTNPNGLYACVLADTVAYFMTTMMLVFFAWSLFAQEMLRGYLIFLHLAAFTHVLRSMSQRVVHRETVATCLLTALEDYMIFGRS